MLKLFSKVSLLAIALVLFYPNAAKSQITPDSTLGTENSRVNSIDELRDRIEGGAIRGENLFHSFEEFSIREGLEVYFANPEEINNIFSRITGNNISEILGTLGVEGTANLFLINPNGIVFGENARIDVGGSFIATTAEKVHLENGEFFNVRDRDKPILTWNAPIGLSLTKNSGEIIVRGEGNNLEIPIPEFNINRENRPTGIEVKPNRTIGLLGSKITLESGNLTASGGRIELGSVIGNESVGLVSTDSGWKLNYEEVTNFGDISLLQEASIDTSGESSGAIQLRGRQINIKDGSAVLANTLGNSTGEGITIKSDVLELSGTTTDNFVSAIATDNIKGVGGDINIDTSQLYMADGSQIRAIVFGNGITGEVNIDAEDIEVTGVNSLNFDYLTSIETSVATESVRGTGKDVNINTKNLLVSGGGRILTDTFGIGNAGDLIVKAENIDLIEFENRELGLITGLSTATRQESTEGNAGNIVIDVGRLRLIDGARIRADARSTGNGGNISIDASNIELSGFSPFNPARKSVISTSTSDFGNGGNIVVNTENLILTDGALISADTSSMGDGGDIDITAQNIELSGSNPIDSSFFLEEYQVVLVLMLLEMVEKSILRQEI